MNGFTDPRFSGASQRIKNWSTLWAMIEEWARKRKSVECEAVLQPSGCPFGRYQTITEAMKQPQVKARDGVVEVSDAAGSFKVPNTPLRFQRANYGIGTKVPSLGEHNRDTLADWLNMDDDAIRALEAEGALHTS